VDARDVFKAAGQGVPADLVAVELRTECPKCGSPLPLDGLDLEVVCGSCSSEIEVERSVFAAALDSCYTDIYHRGRGVMREEHAERDGRDVHWTRGPGGPPCDVCGAELRPAADGSKLVCAEHGEQGAIEPAPEWLRHVDFTIEGFVPPRAVGGDEGQAQKVATRCANCGSSLLADGVKRTVECTYCSTINVLPEDVWRALHPARAPRRFWVMHRLFWDPRRETPSPFAEIKDGLGTLGCAAVFLLPLVLSAVALIVVGHTWLVETFGRTGVIVSWVAGGVVALGLLIYASGYVRRYMRWRRIFKPEQELVGRLGPLREVGDSGGNTDIELFQPGRSDRPITVLGGFPISRIDFERLGGEGSTLRAWMVPGREDLVEVRLSPTVIE
jgi:ribosomal protein S27AE